ncbi:MAG: flagellar motor switch protein FliM [Proteobacteria bacterium]|nr:flagellar motor switch protein FliM [Pseudomonadota bacterium]
MFEDEPDQTLQDSSDSSATNDINEDISNRQDDLAKNWEKRLDETHIINDELDAFFKSEPEESYRLLSQNEIDSILGFTDKNTTKKDGVHAILASEMIYYERLPMLEVVFDRFVRMMTTSLRNFTSDNVEIILDSITTVRFGDYLNGIPLPAMLSVFRAEEWDNYGLLTIDSPLIYSIVDVLLGGRRGTAVMRIEGRPYTTIERSLVERLIYLILTDLGSSFNPISTVNFKFERLETNPRFATIGRPSNAAVLVQLRIEMEDRGGKIDLILPYS